MISFCREAPVAGTPALISNEKMLRDGGMRMTNKIAALSAVALCLLIASVPVWGHHGSAAFDAGKQLVMKGTVTQWAWANPHCFLSYDVKDDGGNVTHWVVETSNPPDMINRGWSKGMFKPGDEVTVTVEPVKSGKPVGRLLDVVLPNGKTMHYASPFRGPGN